MQVRKFLSAAALALALAGCQTTGTSVLPTGGTYAVTALGTVQCDGGTYTFERELTVKVKSCVNPGGLHLTYTGDAVQVCARFNRGWRRYPNARQTGPSSFSVEELNGPGRLCPSHLRPQ